VYDEPRRLFVPDGKSVVNRGQASRLAPTQPQRAFDLAQAIPDGWYRCQAMAHVGRHAPEPLSEKAFKAARAAAADSFDTYQHAGVLAFAITAALDRGRRDLAVAMLEDALALAPLVEPIASRAAALDLLWSTVAHNGDATMREAVIAVVQADVHPDRSWRARRLYRYITDWLAAREPREAAAIIAALPEGKVRAYLERRSVAWAPR